MTAPAGAEPSQKIDLLIESMNSPAGEAAFKQLNEEWISAFFTLEPADRVTLDDPVGTILDVGGDILLVRHGDLYVGCVALVPGADGVFQLSKMAVTPSMQKRGIGRLMLQAALARAAELGAVRLFLGSNTKLTGAIHLYESFGFTHVPADQVGPLPYARANVFMQLTLRR